MADGLMGCLNSSDDLLVQESELMLDDMELPLDQSNINVFGEEVQSLCQ